MAKIILGDGVKIRTTERLKEYWDLPKVVAYYKDGTLLDWLLYDCRAEAKYTEPVKSLETVTDTKELAKRLCDIFGMPFDEAAFVDLEKVNILKAREERLRKFTTNDEVLKNIDKVAFDQKEMNELLDKGVKAIYLVNDKFYIDLGEENITYTGVGEATAVIRSDEPVDFKALGIEFKNIIFDEKYAGIVKTAESKYKELKDVATNKANNNFNSNDNDAVDVNRLITDFNAAVSAAVKDANSFWK